MSLRDKIAGIIEGIKCNTTEYVPPYFTADAIIAALPDYDAQQARITELEGDLEMVETYLKDMVERGDGDAKQLLESLDLEDDDEGMREFWETEGGHYGSM